MTAMFREATLADASIRPRMWEVERCANPESLIRDWIARSAPAIAVYDESVPLYAVFGVVPVNLLTRTGMMWLVASEEAAGYWGDFALIAKRFVGETKDRYDELYGAVFVDQPKAVRFVTWLGFDTAPLTEGVRRFWWRRT